MAYPKVDRTGMAVPTGPTGILDSNRQGVVLGGTAPASIPGDLCTPAVVPIGPAPKK
jgi:hypothetical protein